MTARAGQWMVAIGAPVPAGPGSGVRSTIPLRERWAIREAAAMPRLPDGS